MKFDKYEWTAISIMVFLFILVGFLFLGESILGVIGVGINEFAVDTEVEPLFNK